MTQTLILVPTDAEHQVLAQSLADVLSADDVSSELCGFGPVASAVRATQLIAVHRPQRILLVGIAGSLSPDCRTGEAYTFTDVAMYGIGAGTGSKFQSAGQMGWTHWSPSSDADDRLPVGDIISLHVKSASAMLLTTCAASGTPQDVRDRVALFPDAIAEDMEGFSVALAAQLAALPIQIVRGISNVAGDRDKSRWAVHEALEAAADLTRKVLS